VGVWLRQERAATRAILRQTTGGGGAGADAPARRVIIVDGSVFDENHRGNAAVATRLRELASEADVWVAHQAYLDKVVERDIPRLAAADQLIIDELGLHIAAPPRRP
jgi:hypothetical protein